MPFVLPPHVAPFPFPFRGEIIDSSDNVFATGVPFHIWPVGPRLTDVGVQYDHQGEAAYDQLQNFTEVPNRILLADGQRYRIVEVQPNHYLPHLALRLRRMEASGRG